MSRLLQIIHRPGVSLVTVAGIIGWGLLLIVCYLPMRSIVKERSINMMWGLKPIVVIQVTSTIGAGA